MSTTLDTNSAILHIGSTFIKSFQWFEDDGTTPVNISASLAGDIRVVFQDPTTCKCLTKTLADGVTVTDAANGMFQVEISPAESLQYGWCGTYLYYQVFARAETGTLAGQTDRPFEGYIQLNPAIGCATFEEVTKIVSPWTPPIWTTANVTTSRFVDADSLSHQSLADFLCTMVEDLKTMGIFVGTATTSTATLSGMTSVAGYTGSSNVETDRFFSPEAVSMQELSDTLATVAADLVTIGIFSTTTATAITSNEVPCTIGWSCEVNETEKDRDVDVFASTWQELSLATATFLCDLIDAGILQG